MVDLGVGRWRNPQAIPRPLCANLTAAGILQRDLIVLNDLHYVMAVDALASSHPLSSPADEVMTPAQISELFDSITYNKVLPQ